MTDRGKESSKVQAALFVISIASGSSFLWVMVKVRRSLLLNILTVV